MATSAFPSDIITIEQMANKKMLTTPAEPVQFPLTAEILELVNTMKEKLLALEGVGLAAPQINHSKRIIAIYIPSSAALLRKEVKNYPIHFLFNPTYTPIADEKFADFEACYSVTSKSGKVPRYKKIKLTYFDEHGMQHEAIEEGFYARVLQHEIDHLNGTLILDRLTADCVQGPIDEMMRLRRSELSDEQKKLFDDLLRKKQLKKD
ncbi:polypeptide deformylase [Legionella busanensis]|uniref:Peptide deformylase n=1 Tax=Legionella busanensis TaxID=190655 RepID=A0A378JWW6_9GAMM|nr:peptide deformylase [Legionella busanensis]STX52712.1 polypeptide deformylase [Legionella busanensis]